jgi:hypothetical protein
MALPKGAREIFRSQSEAINISRPTALRLLAKRRLIFYLGFTIY